ncbi:hypothetical protein PMAC_003039 [Pneumocystis sp. 'macacae']|nr:hypothetical protein PMAC_003039 [Pneumocystis sp. 'macacae']
MSNSIYFKFKSQKEPGRISFDGATGLSVFDVKREIILQNKLGTGTEFDLAIYNSNDEEYDDDTTIIPRSTSITVRRLPPSKPGKGTAARYVSGNPSIVSYSRAESYCKKPVELKTKLASSVFNINTVAREKNDPEEAAIQAMFAASDEQWQETQDRLATATPVFRPNNKKLVPVNVPDRPPPTGYICYRCHWIQLCPTLSDPSFDGKLRVKRTTGIPKSFLKTVEKTFDGSSGSFMVNANGEHVIAEPDNASWESYKSKTKVLTASSIYSFKPDDSTLECNLCHKLMKNPSRIPCCSEEYCEECIQTALLESDFICPKCETKDILLDTIQINNDRKEKIEEYINNKMGNENVSVNKKSSLVISNTESAQESELPIESKKRPLSDNNIIPQTLSEQDNQVKDKELNPQFSQQHDISSQINGNFMQFFSDPYMLNPYMVMPMDSAVTQNIYGLPLYNNYKHYPLDISKYGYFPNQQKVFSKEEDSPYTRIPLNDRNTHRHKRMRHADFRELA